MGSFLLKNVKSPNDQQKVKRADQINSNTSQKQFQGDSIKQVVQLTGVIRSIPGSLKYFIALKTKENKIQPKSSLSLIKMQVEFRLTTGGQQTK